MQYPFNVQEPYRTYLLNWEKTIEWRLNKWKFASLKVWDVLILESWESFLVNKLTYHKSFQDMIWKFWKDIIIPGVKSNKDAENVYYKFYTPEDEKKFGVVAIHVDRIDNTKIAA